MGWRGGWCMSGWSGMPVKTSPNGHMTITYGATLLTAQRDKAGNCSR